MVDSLAVWPYAAGPKADKEEPADTVKPVT